MERKQGFFSALKEEVVRGLSPGRSMAKSPARSASPMSRLLRRGRKAHYAASPKPLISRSGSLRPEEALSPLKEGPDRTDGEDSRMEGRWGQWVKRRWNPTTVRGSTGTPRWQGAQRASRSGSG